MNMQCGAELGRVNTIAILLGAVALCVSGCSSGDDTNRGQPHGGSGGSAGTAVAGTGASGTGHAGTGTSGTGGSGGTGNDIDAGPQLPDFDAGPDTLNAVTATDLCERLSTIQCAGEQHCCTSPGRNYDDCKTTMKNGCIDTLQLDEIAQDSVSGFDKDIAKTAFTQFETMASQCDASVAEWGSSLTGLRGILKGTVAPGGSCSAKNLAIKSSVGAALASCTNMASTACMAKLSPSWTCDPRVGAGGACFSDTNCLDGLYCPNPNFALTGATCMTRKAEGAACVNPNECASLFCKQSKCVASGVQPAYCLQN